MDNFNNSEDSHDHSMRVLELISLYDDFMDSITVIADMGCGAGLDINWFATLCDRDETPQPYNYVCYGVDKDLSKMNKVLPPNLYTLEGNFEAPILPRKADLMWSHDAFQYATNPLGTLKLWNEQMNVNGMLAIVVPQSMSYSYNRYAVRTYDGCFFNYNACSLIYMLAVNGFDCKDSYFYKSPNDPWIHVAVYKSEHEPMDPAATKWYDLADKGLLHPSMEASINKFGHLRQEDILLPWLDRDFYFIKD